MAYLSRQILSLGPLLQQNTGLHLLSYRGSAPGDQRCKYRRLILIAQWPLVSATQQSPRLFFSALGTTWPGALHTTPYMPQGALHALHVQPEALYFRNVT